MARRRAERSEEFASKASWAYSSLSCDLVGAAYGMLEDALHDRGRGYRLARTHYTPRAVGSLVLVTTAFEAFVNEAYDLSANQLPWARRFAAQATLLSKHRGLLLATRFRPEATFDTDELETLIDVRNEIVHYLPRPTPTLIERLERRGLLMATPLAPNWDMGQKLASYALAFWAFETVEMSVGQLVTATLGQRWHSMSLAMNFSLYRQCSCPPSDLAAFDRAHGLVLTETS